MSRVTFGLFEESGDFCVVGVNGEGDVRRVEGGLLRFLGLCEFCFFFIRWGVFRRLWVDFGCCVGVRFFWFSCGS